MNTVKAQFLFGRSEDNGVNLIGEDSILLTGADFPLALLRYLPFVSQFSPQIVLGTLSEMVEELKWSTKDLLVQPTQK